MDYNVQMDVAAALHVLTHCRPTLVPLHVTVETTLRHADLAALSSGDPVSALIARQAAAYAAAGEFKSDEHAACAELPSDFINHLYDPLACVQINRGIAEYLSTHQLPNVQQLVGTLLS